VIWNFNANLNIRENIVLGADANIKITLSYLKNADLDKSDWSKLQFENKTNKHLVIESASFSIIREKTNQKSGNSK